MGGATGRIDGIEGESKNMQSGIAFRRQLISNPDLVFRFKEGAGLAKYKRKSFLCSKGHHVPVLGLLSNKRTH